MTINADEVLDRWAKRMATRDIAAELGLGDGKQAMKKILNIVAYARAQHDERAIFLKSSKHNDLPKMPKAGARRGRPPTRRQRLEAARAAGEALPGWHFGVTSIEVTWLGTGSRDCERVTVSVSCVPTRPPITQVVRSTTRRKTDAHKTFASAFAGRSALQDAGVAGGSDRAAGSSEAKTSPQES